MQLRNLVNSVPLPDNVAEYAVKLCGSSRPGDPRAGEFVKDYVSFGAGPRGSQNLVMAAKARALLEGRTAPIIADVKAVAIPVLRHRLVGNHRAIGDGISTDDIVDRLIKEIGG